MSAFTNIAIGTCVGATVSIVLSLAIYYNSNTPDRNKDLVNGIAYGTMGGAIGGAVGGLIGAEIAGGAIGAGVGIVYLIAQSTKDATR